MVTAKDNGDVRIMASLRERASDIAEGDLLLWRRRGIISIAGRGKHTHAGKASWWDDDLFCLEIREMKGGRAVTLESQVAKYPGQIDVYEVNAGGRWDSTYDRDKASRAMRLKAGREYGYRNLLYAAMRHMFIIRLWLKAPKHETPADSPEFCSQAVSSAERVGGMDTVLNLVDRLTEPADLARSPFYAYRFTLEP